MDAHIFDIACFALPVLVTIGLFIFRRWSDDDVTLSKNEHRAQKYVGSTWGTYSPPPPPQPVGPPPLTDGRRLASSGFYNEPG